MNKEKNTRNSGSDPESTAIVNDEISRRLRSMYRDIESEEIPDRFLTLLEELDKAEKRQSGGDADE